MTFKITSQVAGLHERRARVASPSQVAPFQPSAFSLRPLRIAANAARAVGRNALSVASGHPLRVDAATAAARLAVCRACEQYIPDAQRCGHARCGCYLRFKTALKAERCPDGRWPAPKISMSEDGGLGVRRQSASADAAFRPIGNRDQSGVASDLPPHSKAPADPSAHTSHSDPSVP